jgi:phage replication-related protein YjqB (UPF0714/DUF867 family)
VRGFAVALILVFFGSAISQLSQATDRYDSFADLQRNEIETRDFSVRTFEQGEIGVLVIHGGAIEFGTSEIGASLMGDDWSGYFFEGIKPSKNLDLHLTATRFDEPRALAFIARQSRCVSVHGFADNENSTLCLGGGDSGLIQRLLLSSPGEQIFRATECPRFSSRSRRNIVNRCGRPVTRGLQLELSAKLRRELLGDPQRMRSFVGWIRAAYQNSK